MITASVCVWDNYFNPSKICPLSNAVKNCKRKQKKKLKMVAVILVLSDP